MSGHPSGVSTWLPSTSSLQWRHNDGHGVSNHQPHDSLLSRLVRRRTKPHVTCRCEGNSAVTGEFPAQRVSDAQNVSIWWHPLAVSRVPFGTQPNYSYWLFGLHAHLGKFLSNQQVVQVNRTILEESEHSSLTMDWIPIKANGVRLLPLRVLLCNLFCWRITVWRCGLRQVILCKDFCVTLKHF